MRALLAAALAVLLFPFAAHASADIVIAAHPLAVVGVAPAESEEFSAVYATELARLNVDLADSVLVRSFLEGQGGSCQGKEACLAQLAKAAKANSALWVTLAPFTPKIVMSAKLVRADGSVARSVAGLEFEKSARSPSSDDIRKACRKLFDTLRLTELELPSLVEEDHGNGNSNPNANGNNPNPNVTNPPAAVTTTTERTFKSKLGLGFAAAGLVGLGVGTVFALQNQSTGDEFERLYQSGHFSPDQSAELLRLKNQADSQRTISAIGFIGGAVLLGAGAYLYVSDTPSGPTASLVVGPSSIGVVGAF